MIGSQRVDHLVRAFERCAVEHHGIRRARRDDGRYRIRPGRSLNGETRAAEQELCDAHEIVVAREDEDADPLDRAQLVPHDDVTACRLAGGELEHRARLA